MKKHLLTLLALLSITSQAKVVMTTFDFEDANKVFTDQSRITSSIVADETLNSNVVSFTCANNAQNGYSFSTYNFAELTKNADKVEISFDFYNTQGCRAIITIGDGEVRGTTGGSSQMTYNGEGGIIRIGSDKSNSLINNSKLSLATLTNQWLKANVTVDIIKKMVSYSISTQENTVIKEEADIAYYSTSASKCSQIDVFGYINNSNCLKIDNISITATEPDVMVNANYTLRYVDQENTVIKEVTKTGLIGRNIELTTSEKEAIYIDETKYSYFNDNSAGMTIAEDNSTIVTIIMKKIQKIDTSIVAKDADDVEIGKYTTSVFEDEQTTLYYNKYIKAGNQYFEIARNNAEPYYGMVINAGDSKTITYSLSDICYFAEIENLAPSKAYVANGDTPGRYSNGTAGRLGANTYTTLNFTSTEDAIYTITLWARNRSSSSATINVNYIDADGNKQTLDCTFPMWAKSECTTKSVQFTLPAQCTPIIENTNEWNSNLEMDYVTLTKLGETSKTITPSAATEKAALNGMLSFYDNNIAYQISGAKAYYAEKSSDASVSLVEITDGIIPAKCGVIIQGTPGEAFTMTATTTEATYENNVLTGVATETAATSINADGVYVLGLDSNNANPALYRFKGNLSPSKAYVDPSVFGSASAPMIRIAANTTAINAIESVEQNSQIIYDLNGRRSSSLNKGLNLVNGKKVMIK